MDIDKKRIKEKQVVSRMIHIYCHGKKHGHEKETLCSQCQELLDYAMFRTDKCPHMESKTFCSNCQTHCYKPDMREKIRSVMRYSGPRIIFYHPFLAIDHLIQSFKEKRELENC